MTVLQYGPDIATLTGKYAMIADRIIPGSSVLDVGCYTGGLAAKLAAKGYKVTGIERDPEAALIARSLGVPVLCGDIEDQNWVAGLNLDADAILLLDVLEHLRDPAAVLRQLRLFLRGAGRVLVTGPNVAYWGLRKALLFGNWEYGDAGLMDRTHLRFFTRTTWTRLLEETGYGVLTSEVVDGVLPLQTRLEAMPVLRSGLRPIFRSAIRRWPELFASTFLFEAERADR